MNATELRRAVGRLKCHLIDELPYSRQVERMPGIRDHLRASLSDLPPIPAPREPIYEIHMLCGHRDADMGIWASWSLMRFLEDRAELFVHSDGSLTEEDEDAWAAVIPGLKVIHRAAADAKLERVLGHTKHLHAWRSVYKTSPQLIDAHLFGTAPVRLVMDSDVLVFHEPTELMAALRKPVFTWCNDLRNAYSAPPELFAEVTGLRLPDRFNCGFLGTPRLTLEDFEKLDGLMDRIHLDGRIQLTRYWACQTYYALLSTFVPGSAALPARYDTTGGRTPDACVVRHYVGIPKVRFRYFTEGIPRLLQQVRLPVAA